MSRIRLPAILTISGLVVVTVSLFRPHTYSFLLFMMAVPAIVAGAVFFFFSPRQKKGRGP